MDKKARRKDMYGVNIINSKKVRDIMKVNNALKSDEKHCILSSRNGFGNEMPLAL